MGGILTQGGGAGAGLAGLRRGGVAGVDAAPGGPGRGGAPAPGRGPVLPVPRSGTRWRPGAGADELTAAIRLARADSTRAGPRDQLIVRSSRPRAEPRVLAA